MSTPVIGTVASEGIPMVTTAGRPNGTCCWMGSGCAAAADADAMTMTTPHARLRAMRRTLATVVTGLAVLIVTAPPAAAHSVAGQGSTNYQSRIRSIAPAVAGLKVKIIEAGSRIELTNHTGHTVTVLGYQDEPYLRIGPDGVFENRRSPAVYINSVRNNPPPVPADADPTAPPKWQRTGGGNVARWHDHRAHWMGTQNPPIVRRAPGKFHVVTAGWTLKLLDGTRKVTVTGDLDWVPGPSPLPWALLALAGAAVVIVGAFTRAWRVVLIGATAAIVLADVVHTVGVGFVSQTSTAGRLARIVTTTPYSLAAWVIGVVGIVFLLTRPYVGLYAVSFGAIVIGGLGGLGDLSDLYHSQLASFLGAQPVRAAIALSLGLAVGIPVACYVAVRRGNVHAPEREPEQSVAAPAPSAA